MKNSLLFGLAALAVLSGCAKKEVFIEGKMEGLNKVAPRGKVYLYEYGWTSPVLVDSAKIAKDDSFVFYKGKKGPGEYSIRTDIDERRAWDMRRFFVENEKVSIEGNMEQSYRAKVTGSTTDSLYRDFRSRSLLQDKQGTIDYIAAHSDNLVAPFILTRHLVKWIPYSTADSLLNLMPERLRKSTFGRRARFIADAAENTRIGKPFTEIAEKDIDGNTKKLSDAVKNNKYTLLTFWASWCGDCRNNIPDFKELYAEYKPKGLEIYSVSMDYTYEEWANYLKNNGITWINVSDIKGWDCVPADRYNVQTITSTYLIDQNGIIVDKLLKGEPLKKRIAELFAE